MKKDVENGLTNLINLIKIFQLLTDPETPKIMRDLRYLENVRQEQIYLSKLATEQYEREKENEPPLRT
jgi:hypothetical protein